MKSKLIILVFFVALFTSCNNIEQKKSDLLLDTTNVPKKINFDKKIFLGFYTGMSVSEYSNNISDLYNNEKIQVDVHNSSNEYNYLSKPLPIGGMRPKLKELLGIQLDQTGQIVKPINLEEEQAKVPYVEIGGFEGNPNVVIDPNKTIDATDLVSNNLTEILKEKESKYPSVTSNMLAYYDFYLGSDLGTYKSEFIPNFTNESNKLKGVFITLKINEEDKEKIKDIYTHIIQMYLEKYGMYVSKYSSIYDTYDTYKWEYSYINISLSS